MGLRSRAGSTRYRLYNGVLIMTNRRGSTAALVIGWLAIATASLLVEANPQQRATDPALIARGDSVFHGKLGGAICTVCHGPNAKGVAGMGPDLTDAEWLHGDGSPAFIAKIVRTGVSKPKKSAAVMPPFGGTPLDSAKVEAVAAYLFSLKPTKR